jgi:hypothetical protein
LQSILAELLNALVEINNSVFTRIHCVFFVRILIKKKQIDTFVQRTGQGWQDYVNVPVYRRRMVRVDRRGQGSVVGLLY